MIPEHKNLIKSTWRQVTPIADDAADLFYRRLFEVDPELEPLFADVDMPQQRTKLIGALAAVVGSLENLDALRPTLETLGRRHVDYGAEPRHYESVGAALLWTLEQGLGESWSPDARTAWTEAYTWVVEAMLEGAGEPRPAA